MGRLRSIQFDEFTGSTAISFWRGILLTNNYSVKELVLGNMYFIYYLAATHVLYYTFFLAFLIYGTGYTARGVINAFVFLLPILYLPLIHFIVLCALDYAQYYMSSLPPRIPVGFRLTCWCISSALTAIEAGLFGYFISIYVLNSQDSTLTLSDDGRANTVLVLCLLFLLYLYANSMINCVFIFVKITLKRGRSSYLVSREVEFHDICNRGYTDFEMNGFVDWVFSAEPPTFSKSPLHLELEIRKRKVEIREKFGIAAAEEEEGTSELEEGDETFQDKLNEAQLQEHSRMWLQSPWRVGKSLYPLGEDVIMPFDRGCLPRHEKRLRMAVIGFFILGLSNLFLSSPFGGMGIFGGLVSAVFSWRNVQSRCYGVAYFSTVVSTVAILFYIAEYWTVLLVVSLVGSAIVDGTGNDNLPPYWILLAVPTGLFLLTARIALLTSLVVGQGVMLWFQVKVAHILCRAAVYRFMAPLRKNDTVGLVDKEVLEQIVSSQTEESAWVRLRSLAAKVSFGGIIASAAATAYYSVWFVLFLVSANPAAVVLVTAGFLGSYIHLFSCICGFIANGGFYFTSISRVLLILSYVSAIVGFVGQVLQIPLFFLIGLITITAGLLLLYIGPLSAAIFFLLFGLWVMIAVVLGTIQCAFVVLNVILSAKYWKQYRMPTDDPTVTVADGMHDQPMSSEHLETEQAESVETFDREMPVEEIFLEKKNDTSESNHAQEELPDARDHPCESAVEYEVLHLPKTDPRGDRPLWPHVVSCLLPDVSFPFGLVAALCAAAAVICNRSSAPQIRKAAQPLARCAVVMTLVSLFILIMILTILAFWMVLLVISPLWAGPTDIGARVLSVVLLSMLAISLLCRMLLQCWGMSVIIALDMERLTLTPATSESEFGSARTKMALAVILHSTSLVHVPAEGEDVAEAIFHTFLEVIAELF